MKLLVVAITTALLAGCSEPGDHGGRTIVELVDSNGKTVRLACPEYNASPLGSHGRECYLVKGESE